MRIVFLNLPYPPDPTPTGRALHELAKVLVHRGHEAHVLCSSRPNDGGPPFPSMPLLDEVRVHRVPAPGLGRKSALRRMVDYFCYYAMVLVTLCFCLPRPHVIVALTTPPFLGLAARFASWLRRCTYVQWVMDLYPDILAAAGVLKPWSVIFPILRFLGGCEMRGAKLILTLGPYMAAQIQKSASNSSSIASRNLAIQWIPLAAEPVLMDLPPAQSTRIRQERGWSKEDLVLMYSGNMGVGHRFSEFLEASNRLGPSGPIWAFISSTGFRRQEVAEFARSHPEARIHILSAVPFEKLGESLRSADVQMISLDSRWQGLAVPSKIQGIMAVGRPAIFVGNRRNEIAKWIMDAGCGWVVEENNVEALLVAIKEASDPRERERRGDLGRQYAEKHFSPRDNYAEIARILEQSAASQ